MLSGSPFGVDNERLEGELLGERPRPWGPPMAWDATTSTLIFGENEAVQVDTLTTAGEARRG
jgi:hypothetical protein